MIKAIFFDFDGVLTSDATGTTSIVNYIKSNTQIDSRNFENAYRKHNKNLLYGKTTHIEVWPLICKELGENIDFDILLKSFLSTPVDVEMIKISKQLKEEGYYIGIITDNKKDRIDSIFSKSEYELIFDRIIVSSDIGSGKKQQAIFDAAIMNCDFKFRDCIFIDNNKDNLIVPRQLGINTIFFDHEKRDYEQLTSDVNEIVVSLAV